MKEYKVVCIDDRDYTAACNETTFSGICGRIGQQYVMDHYAKLGWRFVQIMKDFTETRRYFYLYFERDAAETKE